MNRKKSITMKSLLDIVVAEVVKADQLDARATLNEAEAACANAKTESEYNLACKRYAAAYRAMRQDETGGKLT